MRVLHLDLPRSLAFSLKEWQVDFASCLSADGATYHQADLNFDFWRFILDDEVTDRFGRFVDLPHQADAFNFALVNSSRATLERKSRTLECSLGFGGVAFPRSATRSFQGLLEYVDGSPDRELFDRFFLQVQRDRMLLSGYSILSLGIDSLEGLVFAGLLASFVRRNAEGIHICLARHQYENFALTPELPGLFERGEIFRLFDSVLVYEEDAAPAMAGLRHFLRTGDRARLRNVALRIQGEVVQFPPAPADARESVRRTAPADPADEGDDGLEAYVRTVGVPADRLLYLTPLIRNSCYYAGCTFCAQNVRYIGHQFHKHEPEIDRSIGLVRRLTAAGVRRVSWMDQALHPSTIRTLCRRLLDEGLELEWYVRMLFDPGLDAELLALMKRAGCREILFGLESVNPDALTTLGKRPIDFSLDGAFALLDRCEAAELDVVLNFIQGTPTETDAEFRETTWSFFRRCAGRYGNITYIINPFTLFRGTPMAADPSAFGIQHVFRDGSDLEHQLDYIDVHGRRGSERVVPSAFRLAALGVDPEAAPAERLDLCPHLLADLAGLNYGSIGLAFRSATGAYLGPRLLESAWQSRAGEAAPPPRDPFRAPAGGPRDALLIGCNAYLGQNLARALDPDRLVLSSRRRPNAVASSVQAPFVPQDLARGHDRLRELSPAEVFLVSRPRSAAFDLNAAFADNLKRLLHAWASRGSLRKVVLFSTQLVYATPKDARAIDSARGTRPSATYEYFKVELENFLAYLSDAFTLECRILRLPLLAGGAILPAQRKEQLLYGWADALASGADWSFDEPGDRKYGNSWASVEDLVRAVAELPVGPGLDVRNVSSGEFTYRQLHEMFAGTGTRRRGGVAASAVTDPVRSTFFLKDEAGLPPRGLADLRAAIEPPVSSRVAEPATPADPAVTRSRNGRRTLPVLGSPA